MQNEMEVVLNRIFETNLGYLARWDTLLANHVSMAAAAMFLMGERSGVRPSKLLDDAACNTRNLSPRRTNAGAIAFERLPWPVQRELLGLDDLWESWEALFIQEFDGDDLDEPIRRWVERLGFGLCAAAGHSIIRIHFALAVREVLAKRILRRELAIAFADLASRYTILTANDFAAGEESLEAFLDNHPSPPDAVTDLVCSGMLIEDRFLLLRTDDLFRQTAIGISLDYDILECLRRLASLVGEDFDITLLHAITVGEAVHGICTCLSNFDARSLLQGYRDFVVATVFASGLQNTILGRKPQTSIDAVFARVPTLATDHAQKATFSLTRLFEETGYSEFVEAARHFQDALG